MEIIVKDPFEDIGNRKYASMQIIGLGYYKFGIKTHIVDRK
jgi:hypothetical protein